MAAREDEPQSVVRDRVMASSSIGVRIEASSSASIAASRAEQLGLLDAAARARRSRSIARLRAVVVIQAPGLSGTPRTGQRLEGGDERVLDRLLGEVEVAEDADQRRDRATLLLAEEAVDDLVGGLGPVSDAERRSRGVSSGRRRRRLAVARAGRSPRSAGPRWSRARAPGIIAA